MMCQLNDTQVKNLFAFLDRVPCKGLNEIQAMNELLVVFNTSVESKPTEALPETK